MTAMKIDTVLYPLDFSRLSRAELELAVQVCEAFGARFVLQRNLSAIHPGSAQIWRWQDHLSPEGERRLKRRLAAFMARLPSSVRRETMMTHGPLAAAVATLAKNLPADLVMLGLRSGGRHHAAMVERIIEHAPCPVLTVRDAEALRVFRRGLASNRKGWRVLVLTDFSPSASRAVACAVELARLFPIEIHLLHVSAGPGAEAALEALATLVPADLKDRVQCDLRVGRTIEEIYTVLRQVSPQLIVMGTHARRFWRRVFTPDMARRVLRDAQCPVCFVPPARQIDRDTASPSAAAR